MNARAAGRTGGRWFIGRGAPSWAGLFALVLALAGLAVDPAVFFAAWLAAWWTCLGIALGALVRWTTPHPHGSRWSPGIGGPSGRAGSQPATTSQVQENFMSWTTSLRV